MRVEARKFVGIPHAQHLKRIARKALFSRYVDFVYRLVVFFISESEGYWSPTQISLDMPLIQSLMGGRVP